MVPLLVALLPLSTVAAGLWVTTVRPQQERCPLVYGKAGQHSSHRDSWGTIGRGDNNQAFSSSWPTPTPLNCQPVLGQANPASRLRCSRDTLRVPMQRRWCSEVGRLHGRGRREGPAEKSVGGCCLCLCSPWALATRARAMIWSIMTVCIYTIQYTRCCRRGDGRYTGNGQPRSAQGKPGQSSNCELCPLIPPAHLPRPSVASRPALPQHPENSWVTEQP